MPTDSILHQIVEEYKGPPLKMVLAGAGAYAMRILEVPGASAVLDSIYVPYSSERMEQWLLSYHPRPALAKEVFDAHPKVSLELLDTLHVANCSKLGESDVTPLTITAAITSKKQRQGANQAFVSFGPPAASENWHIQLHKLEDVDFKDAYFVEQRRFIQDRIISEVALSLVTGIESELRTEMVNSGFVRKV